MKPTKRDRPVRNTGADCERCLDYHGKGANFCGICGKKLVENPVIKTYKTSGRRTLPG